MEKMLKFKEFNEYKDGYLTIFDIDDTLFHTTAQIIIRKPGAAPKRLTSAEYNTYKIQPGETPDFSEFSDADLFYKESKPITRMLDKAKAILADTKNHPNNRVIIVTARPDLDDRDKFLATFKKYGLDIDSVRVERAGKINAPSPGQAKAIIINNYLNTKQYNKVRLFDDSINNLKEFLKLERLVPAVKFKAWHAHIDGTVNEIK
jgi:FMN phosphatase YigB (HAD superfamily)